MNLTGNLYGMLSTRASERYTGPALASLLQNTPITAEDEVVIIDNDGSYVLPQMFSHHPITLLRPSEPASFAANANTLLQRAAGRGLFLLNNDLIFPPGWSEPLRSDDRTIQSPLSNGQTQYQTPTFHCRSTLTLESFAGHETALNEIAAHHRERATTPLPVLVLPFFCVRIPAPVYRTVGPFDLRYGPAGGEDYDYCVRAHLAGFGVQFAARSFVLHFGGQATWAGPEDTKARASRETAFVQQFRQRWGEAVARIVFAELTDPLAGQPALQTLAQERRFGDLLRALGAETQRIP